MSLVRLRLMGQRILLWNKIIICKSIILTQIFSPKCIPHTDYFMELCNLASNLFSLSLSLSFI